MSMAIDNMAQLEQVSEQPERRSRWRYYGWVLLSITCAVLMIVTGHFGPGEPLNGIYFWIGIVALVWVIAQVMYSEVSLWCIRAGTGLYFDAIYDGTWPHPGETMKMADYWKWCRARGWRFWWRLMRNNHRV